MSRSLVNRVHVSLRILAVVLAAIVLAVPAAVRATQPVKSSASSIRLNRGFDKPVEKQFVLPANEPAVVPAVLTLSQAETRVTIHPVIGRDEALPDSPRSTAPDPLRGPPTLTF